MTILLGAALWFFGFWLGLLTAEWARVHVDRAVRRAKLAAWTDKLERTPTDDPAGFQYRTPLAHYQQLVALRAQFPALSVHQLDDVLNRRAQERRS